MSAILTLDATVGYGEVDRDEQLTLASLFKHLQEAAIAHANQFDTGGRSAETRGEFWVLNRMQVGIIRYPKYNDRLRIETWSRGITGFRGYREYRIYQGTERIVSASALWVYLNVTTRSLQRVPPEIIDAFPIVTADIFAPDLDQLDPTPPAESCRQSFTVSVRYSDIDGNGHVNNTAYLDFIQTALTRAHLPQRPNTLSIRFMREVSAETAEIQVHLEPREGETAFNVGSGNISFAEGTLI